MITEASVAGSEEFAGRLGDMVNGGTLSLMLAIGHRVGLFDAMASMTPSTSSKIAHAAGLDERYVREWLAAMTVGGIVDHDPNEMTFALPPERAAWLTRTAGAENLAMHAQWIGILAGVEDQIVDCFRRGGGVPYSQYPKLQAVLAEIKGTEHDATLIPTILSLVPGLTGRLSQGIDVADVGCGSGHAINLMAEAYPNSHFFGLDISDDGLAAGTAEAERKSLSNVQFEKQDAARLDGSKQFDFITTFDAVHDQVRPDLVLRGIAESLRPDGVYLCVDIAASSILADNLEHPFAPLLYSISCMHCMAVSLAEGGMGLGAMWGHQKANEMLAEAGFTSVERKQLDDDIFNYYYVATKG
jgi:SAM-dependent methyltransferase